jgi:hypothetical protein
MERFDCDSAYGSADMLNWLVHARGIEPHGHTLGLSLWTSGR